jgi:hypothetical protein
VLAERGGRVWHVPSLGRKNALGTYQDVLEHKSGILKVPVFNMQEVKISDEDGCMSVDVLVNPSGNGSVDVRVSILYVISSN